jgi:hypothetical protein
MTPWPGPSSKPACYAALPNLIEEIEAVGRSELRSCESLLRLALVHLLKLRTWPDSLAAGHWRSEIIGFLADARRSFTPSMRQRIDLEALYADAREQVGVGDDDSGARRATPDTCPFDLDELLRQRPSLVDLSAKLSTADRSDRATS